MFQDLTTEQVVVERLRVGATNYVQRNVELSIEQSFGIFDQMMLRLSSEVLAQSLDKKTHSETVYFDFPRSPWQFFKQRHQFSWWLGWFVDRRPVLLEQQQVITKVDVEQMFIYPDANVALPEATMGKPILIHRVTDR